MRIHTKDARTSRARPSGSVLVRFGTEYEGHDTLEAQSHAALERPAISVHGVSVFKLDVPLRNPGSVAAHAEVERYFRVMKTGANAAHYTVETPHPVTEADAACSTECSGELNEVA